MKLVLVSILTVVLVGCASVSVSPELVRKKASHDLECAPDEIQVTKVTDGNWSVVGCEKKASYVCSGSNFMSDGMCMREQ
jgi:hypothetical protein